MNVLCCDNTINFDKLDQIIDESDIKTNNINDQVNLSNDKITSILSDWNEMVSQHRSIFAKHPNSVRRDTKKYKLSRTTFIFYHDFDTLYCFSECIAGIDNNNNNGLKSILVNKSTNELSKMKIVDFWHQRNVLYL